MNQIEQYKDNTSRVDFFDSFPVYELFVNMLYKCFDKEWQESTDFYQRALTNKERKEIDKRWPGWLYVFCGLDPFYRGLDIKGIIEGIPFYNKKENPDDSYFSIPVIGETDITPILLLHEIVSRDHFETCTFFLRDNEGNAFTNEKEHSDAWRIEMLFSFLIKEHGTVHQKLLELIGKYGTGDTCYIADSKKRFDFYEAYKNIIEEPVNYGIAESKIFQELMEDPKIDVRYVRHKSISEFNIEEILKEVPKDAPAIVEKEAFLKENLGL